MAASLPCWAQAPAPPPLSTAPPPPSTAPPPPETTPAQCDPSYPDVCLDPRPRPPPPSLTCPGCCRAAIAAILFGVTGSDPKADLHRYLQAGREALLWKLDGLSEYDIRRPMVPTGTNLLGIVKHVAGVEAGYLGDTFGRPFEEPLPWLDDDAEPNADMWATAEESR